MTGDRIRETILAEGDKDRMYQPFLITSLCRFDLVRDLDWPEDKALGVSDEQMKGICKKMASEVAYYSGLEEIVKSVIN
jgi:hypothetical protein